MCARDAILGAKSGSCISRVLRSRSFIVTSQFGLEEDTRCAWVSGEKDERQKKYWTSES